MNSVKFLAIILVYSNFFFPDPFSSLLPKPKFLYVRPFDMVPQLLDVSHLFSLCYTRKIPVNPSSVSLILPSAVSSLSTNLQKTLIFDTPC